MNVLLIGSRPLERQGPGDAKLGFWTWKALSGAGHTVSIVILQTEAAAWRARHTLRAAISGQPLQTGVTFSRAAYQRITKLTALPDVVVAVHARSTRHVPAALRPRGLALLIDSYGQSYRTYAGRIAKPIDLLYRFERRRMDVYERTVAAEFARTAVVSELDREYLQQSVASPSSIVRFTLPVDLGFFSKTRRRPAGPSPVIAFVGRLSYLPNRDALRWLANAIWPCLRARWPTARMRVIGAGPDGGVRRLLKRRGVELVADVADIRPYLEDVTALLVPMRMGGGVQTKTLEAMAAGVPVISTAFGCRGIAVQPDQQVLLAETPEDFRRQAERLVTRQTFGEELAAAAKAWVEAHHDPQLFERDVLESCAAIATQVEREAVRYD